MRYTLMAILFVVSNFIFGVANHVKMPFKINKPKPGHVYSIAVVGSGVAGVAVANRSVLNNDEVLLFTGSKKSLANARGSWVRTVDNTPGMNDYQRAVLDIREKTLSELSQSKLGHNLSIVEDQVNTVSKDGDVFTLQDSEGKTYQARFLVIATGIMDTQPHIKGSIKPVLPYANAQNIAYCIKCDGHRSYGKRVAIIGHNSSSAAIARILLERYELPRIIVLTNGEKPEWSEEQLAYMKEHNIEYNLQPIEKVHGKKRVLHGFEFADGSTVDVDMAYVSLGVRPNNDLAKQMQVDLDDRGLVIANDNGETSVPGVYVVGDLRSERPKQIYTAIADATSCADSINRITRTEKSVGACSLDSWKPYVEEAAALTKEAEEVQKKKSFCTKMMDCVKHMSKSVTGIFKRNPQDK